MTIKEQIPITMPEVIDLVGDEEKTEQLKAFIKRFTKMKLGRVKEMKSELKKLDLIKLKEEHIVNIINFAPEDAEDLIKILQGVSLDQDEVIKILEVIKKY